MSDKTSSFFECLNSTAKRLVFCRIYARSTVNQSEHEGCHHIGEYTNQKTLMAYPPITVRQTLTYLVCINQAEHEGVNTNRLHQSQYPHGTSTNPCSVHIHSFKWRLSIMVVLFINMGDPLVTMPVLQWSYAIE